MFLNISGNITEGAIQPSCFLLHWSVVF